MQSYTVFHIQPADPIQFSVDTIDAETQQAAHDAAIYKHGERCVIGVIASNDPVFERIKLIFSTLWPHLRMFPMCGCDRNALWAVASIATILGFDNPVQTAIYAGNEGESAGMRQVHQWLADHPVWQTKMSSRLHRQLVAEMNEFIAETEGKSVE